MACGPEGETTIPPVTKPVLPTVATVLTVVLQIPPVVASLSWVVRPEQIEVTPVMGAGNAFTVTVVVMIQLVPSV